MEDFGFCISESYNKAINAGLRYFIPQDAAALSQKFRAYRNDEPQFLHTFQELLAGVFIVRQGWEARYDRKLHGQTPDWVAIDGHGTNAFFADVVNFHIDKPIEAQQKDKLDKGETWFGYLPDNQLRLYQSLQQKASTYKDLGEKLDLPYVIFVYSFFSAFLQELEVLGCLESEDAGLFHLYPNLSGVYHMSRGWSLCDPSSEETHRFEYYPNPQASRPTVLQSGSIPIVISEPR